MKQQDLNSMKYGDLFMLAKEKLNITRRVSKEKLIEKLLKWHQSVLSDSNFISADESTGSSTMDCDEPIQKRGRKRGNQYCDEKKPAVSNKKAKKTKKEIVEHTLNSTFSVDEDEDVSDKTINVDLPVVTSKPAKSRKLRGKKNDVYLTEESSANESESQKTPVSLAKKSRRLNEKPPPNNATDKRIPVVRLKRLDTSGLNEDSSVVISSPEKTVVNEKMKQSVENQTSKKRSNPQSPVNEKIAPKKLKKSKSAVSIENSPANEPEIKNMSVRRTRSFGQMEIPAVENQTSVDQQQKEVLSKKLQESVSNSPSPQKEPCLKSPVAFGKKMPLRRTSTHPLRSRKPTVNSPVKKTTIAPVGGKITPKKLKKSKSAASIENSPANELEMKKMPVRRSRSSGQMEIPAVENQTSADQQQKELTKNLKKSGSIAASPQIKPSLQSPVAVGKKMPLRRTSTHPLRSRKPTVNSPAKRTTMTPIASAKKAVQFTAKNDASNIPKMTKPKAAPNFAEIHQKNFLKMQSVDEYVEKKRTRTETMNSAKSVRTRSVLNKTPQAKPAVIVKPKAVTPDSMTTRNMKFNFVSGLQKPVFTAKGQVVNEKQRVMATVKENLHNASQMSAVTTTTTAAAKGKRKASLLNVSSREVNVSKLSMAGKQILKGVRTNRRFDLQMKHRNMKN